MMLKLKHKIQKSIIRVKAFFKIQPKLLIDNNVRILVYHGITKNNPLQFNSRFIHVTTFQKHLAYFKSNDNINICTVQNIIDNKIKGDKLNIALTFDDGYFNNYQLALPLLKNFDIPATFSITNVGENKNIIWCDLLDIILNKLPETLIKIADITYQFKKDFPIIKSAFYDANEAQLEELTCQLQDLFDSIKQDETLTDFWKLMSKKELKELSQDPLFEIVGHGECHLQLKGKNKATQEVEIQTSISFALQFGETNHIFALPFGGYDSITLDILKNIGVSTILGIDSKNKAVLERFTINPHVDFMSQMHFIFKGTYI